MTCAVCGDECICRDVDDTPLPDELPVPPPTSMAAGSGNAYACAVLVIDTNESPPRVLGVGVFSESSPTLGAHRWCFVLKEARAASYEVARRHVIDELRRDPWYQWAWRLVPERDRR